MSQPAYPIVPADAGTQSLPHSKTSVSGKVWIPAVRGNERVWRFLQTHFGGNEQ
jgi:hypothetical protein